MALLTRVVSWLRGRLTTADPQEDVIGSLPYFPCYHQRWLASTAHLSLAAQGLYWRYLCWMADNGPLPLDEEARVHAAGISTREWRKLWPKISSKFIESPAGYYNQRLEDTLAEVRKYSESQKTRANQRWEQARARPAASATGLPGASRYGTQSHANRMLPISTKKKDPERPEIPVLREHLVTSTQDPPAAPDFAVEKLWKADEATDVPTSLRDRPEVLPSRPGHRDMGGRHETPDRTGRVLSPPASGAVDGGPFGGPGGPQSDDATGPPLTPAQAALELARAILPAGTTVPKAAYCDALYAAAGRLETDAATVEEVTMHGWQIWALYPEDFTLLHPREAPARQLVRRNR